MKALLILIVLLVGSKVDAFNVYRIGGDTGTSWSQPLSFEPGEYEDVGPDGVVNRRIALATQRSFATWRDTLSALIDSTGGQWLRPLFLPDTLNLAQDGVRDRLRRGTTSNIITSGDCYNVTPQVIRIRPMFDGDPNTAAFFQAFNTEDADSRVGFYVQNSIIDLGIDYPINRVRFFPRLGTSNPKIGEVLDNVAAPKLAKENLQEEDFSENFLPWFEVAAANSIHNFAPNCYLSTAESPWFSHVNRGSFDPPTDARFTRLRKDTENQDVVVDIRFPLQQFQWIGIRPVGPIKNWEIAEFQVFGEGYVPRMVYTTTVLDMGAPMAWGKLRWKGDRDEEAQVFIRTRTGSDHDPNLYWLPSTIPGEFKELDRQQFERANIQTRFTTLDRDHWSFWSSPYPWNAGVADTTLTATAWQDGTPILSPGPSRYIQVQIIVLSTRDQTARLRDLELQFSEPAAIDVVGEVWPLDVPRTASTTFTYSVRPTLDTAEQGFDRLEIFTLTRADAVHSVRLDGVEMIDSFAPQFFEDRLVISFPRLQGPDDTFKLIEVKFDAHVVRYGTEFTGWVYDSQAEGVKQLIGAGNATLEFPGNALGVRTEGLGAKLLTEVEVLPNPFTPNGDEVNDKVRFVFQIHEVSTPRQLQVNIFDLSGRLVRRLENQEAMRGLVGDRPGDPRWDGTDAAGDLVAPGLYLYQVSLETDEGAEEATGTIAVAY